MGSSTACRRPDAPTHDWATTRPRARLASHVHLLSLPTSADASQRGHPNSPSRPPNPAPGPSAQTDLLAHLSTNVREALLAIKAHGLDPSVTEHLEHLRVLCRGGERRVRSAQKEFGVNGQWWGRTLTVLLEDELALVRLVLVLASSTVLASLHAEQGRGVSSVIPASCAPQGARARGRRRTFPLA